MTTESKDISLLSIYWEATVDSEWDGNGKHTIWVPLVELSEGNSIIGLDYCSTCRQIEQYRTGGTLQRRQWA